MIKEMREPTFLVLATLAEGKKHGYAIIQGVASLSEGEVEIKAGTLYAMLDRLAFDGRLRRYYELTPQGTTLLAEESKRRVRVSNIALRRLRFVGGFA